MVRQKEKLRDIILFIKNNQWEAAHQLAQQYEGVFAFDRLHALLHRIEGDDWNARWWYNKLGLAFPEQSIEDEINSLHNWINQMEE